MIRSILATIVALMMLVSNAFAGEPYYVGFEVGDQAESSGNQSTAFTNNPSLVRSGTYALKIEALTTTATPYYQVGTISGTGSTAAGNYPTAKYSIWAYPDTFVASNDEEIISFYDNNAIAPGAHKFSVRVNSTGNLLAYIGATPTLTETSSLTLTPDQYQLLQFTVETGASAGYLVTLNGVTILSGTGVDMGSNPTGRINLGMFTNRNGKSYRFYYDDLIASDTQFYANAKVARFGVLSDANPAQWEGGTIDSNSLEVDEVVRDDDISYIKCFNTTGTKSHYFSMQNASEIGISGVIKAVSVTARAKKEDPLATTAFVIRMRTEGTEIVADTTNKDVSSSYASYRKIKSTNLSNGEWTFDDLDALEVGVLENNPNNVRVTQVFGMVLYDPDDQYDFDPILIYRRLIEDY